MMHTFKYTRKRRDETYGKKPDIKTFYENVVDEDSNLRWVEWAPPAYPMQKRSKWEGFAIQEYKKCDNLWDPLREQSFSLAKLRILSPSLRSILKPVLEPHGIAFEEDYIEISAPLQALYHERHKIQELCDKAEGMEKEHLDVLVALMDRELGPTLGETEDLGKSHQITYKLLWTLMPKGTIIVKSTPEDERVFQGFKVNRTEESADSFRIRCTYIAFDGVSYGTVSSTQDIPYFTGPRKITTLPVFPMEKLGDGYEAVKSSMLARGKRVLDFQDVHYVRYLGPALHDRDGTSDDVRDESKKPYSPWDEQGHLRVMIDPQLSRKYGMMRSVVRLPGYFSNPADAADTSGVVPGRPGNRRQRHVARYDPDMEGWRDEPEMKDTYSFRRLTSDEQERNRSVVSRSETDLMTISPYVNGFALASKSWRSFNVARIEKLDLTSDAFDFLVHSEANKGLLRAVVDDHAERAMLSRDIIAGKGQGLLILLSGSPGTGKTLMAEAVADKTSRPLYSVDSRDLGSSSQLESSLGQIMEDAAAWNAILLLDEADVYLQKRSTDSLEQNKIVAVFLRLLEYYKGIMFLTTNLWENIDEAVESRIQIHLRFPSLDLASRRQVWKNFLQQLYGSICVLTDEDIAEISKWVINGRQIRNVLRIATAWGRRNEQSSIDVGMLHSVIPATCPKAAIECEATAPANGTKGLTNGSKEDGNMIDLLT